MVAEVAVRIVAAGSERAARIHGFAAVDPTIHIPIADAVAMKY